MDLVSIIEKYNDLGIPGVIDHGKFNNIAIVHHSTVLEGSTLTEVETQVLIDEGLTPKGKPLAHSLMVTDHFTALQFALREAENKTPVSIALIQEMNSLLIRNTATIYHTPLGTVDATKGEFRKGNVTAGDTYFPNFNKVLPLTEKLVAAIQTEMKSDLSLAQQVQLSFDAHYNLVTIHPFYDGNGRTSRLLMNFIQAHYGLPLAIVRQESKVDYIEALKATRAKSDINIFRSFMTNQYAAMLKEEILKYETENKPNQGKDRGMYLFL